MFKKKEPEKWIYKIKNIYRLHQDTRYEGTRDTKTALKQNIYQTIWKHQLSLSGDF